MALLKLAMPARSPHANNRTAVLAACGGGGGSSTDAGNTAAPPAATMAVQAQMRRLQLAQTHVLPPEGLSWAQPGGKRIELHLTAGRGALALVDTDPAKLTGAQIEGRVGSTSLGTLALADNSALPPTEDGGERYSATARVAALPPDWLQPGLELRVLATDASASAWQAVSVGAQTSLAIRTLPLYLFGATEALASLDKASLPSAQALDELYAKWPIAQLSVAAHPATKVSWPQRVIAPRNGGPAYVMNSVADRKDGFDPISAVHSATSAIRAANGEAHTANQYYGAMGATQVYPPIGPYNGNLLRTFDPTSASDRAAMTPNTGTYLWYCHASGCDFTLRLTYANGTVRLVVLQGGYRPWFKPADAAQASASDPLSRDSFRSFAVNVPADAALTKVELLDTPQAYQGVSAQPAVLAQRTLP